MIVNHSGDNWAYPAARRDGRRATARPTGTGRATTATPPTRRLPVGAWRWRDEPSSPTIPVGDRGSVDRTKECVPRDLQTPVAYARAGLGGLGDDEVADPHAEHKRTDFFSLKDFALDVGTHPVRPDRPATSTRSRPYDLDGFRIDTVKHMALEDVRNFCGAIGEFADSLGKRNFLLVGEVAGGEQLPGLLPRQPRRPAAQPQRRPRHRRRPAPPRRGRQRPGSPASDYLGGFDAISDGFGSHRSHGTRHVSILDDHDHVFGTKLRFSAEIGDDSPVKDHQVVRRRRRPAVHPRHPVHLLRHRAGVRRARAHPSSAG